MKGRIEVYPTPAGYRWRLKSNNGGMLGEGSKRYSRPNDALRAVLDVFAGTGYPVHMVRTGEPNVVHYCSSHAGDLAAAVP